mgnify:CR=1 FL=1
MWNNIYEITLNLLIGIVGGIFSSVIVSYIFLVDSEYKNQINHAKELFEPIYEIVAIGMAYDQLKESRGKKDARKLTSIDASGRLVGKVPMIETMNNDWNKITAFYSNYESWNYKYELGQIINEIFEIISDGKYLVRNTPEDYAEIRIEFEKCIGKFEACQRDYKKGVAKRIFSSKLIHGMELVFFCILLLFVIA